MSCTRLPDSGAGVQGTVSDCEAAVRAAAKERDEAIATRAAVEETAEESGRLAGTLHRECAARAEQLESLRAGEFPPTLFSCRCQESTHQLS